MSKYDLHVTVVTVAVLLLSTGPASSQNTSPTTDERGLRARDAAVADKARPLVEAEKQRPRIGGYWKVDTFEPSIRAIDGNPAPMNQTARALYRKRVSDRKMGKTNDPVESCLPPGTPRSLWANEPFLLTQTPAKITFFHQYHHIIRPVFLDGPLKINEPDPTWEGHSSGYWNGDILIIETSEFNGMEWLDQAGLPQSPRMKVTERLQLLDQGTLEDRVTIEDPEYYTAPWTTRVVFKRMPDTTLLIEEECSEKLLEFPLKNYQPN
jgi:hypothetical protein